MSEPPKEAPSVEPWGACHRYDYARYLAREGKSVEEIQERCRLTLFTVECIVNRERPGEIDTLNRNQKEDEPC